MYLENNRVRRYPVKIFFAWLMVIIWMGIIFSLSHRSPESTQRISESVAGLLAELSSEQPADDLVPLIAQWVRDIGNALIYLVLAALVSIAFSSLLIHDLPNAGLTMVVCVLYALSDELHQAMVPGRSSQLRDFVIDVIGIVAGIFLYQMISLFRYARSDLKVDRDNTLRL